MSGLLDSAEPDYLITANAIAARQWRLHLAVQAGVAQREAWVGPAVVAYPAWIRSLWQREVADTPVPSRSQTEALWRRIIDESPHGRALISSGTLASAAREAWQSLRANGIEPTALGARSGESEGGDFAAFAEWARAYRAELARRGWLDEADLGWRLGTDLSGGEPRSLRADLGQPSRVQQALLGHLEQRGWIIADALPTGAGALFTVRCTDPQSELRAAIEWLLGHLAADPEARVALVLPDLDRRELELTQALEGFALLGEDGMAAGLLKGERAGRKPLIAAAVTALELFSQEATFATLSRWLRSPFFGRSAHEHSARATLEAELRGDLAAQLGFFEAYRGGGLGVAIARRLPELARALEAAFTWLAAQGRRNTPTRWIRIWTELLGMLTWHGTSMDAEARELAGWEASLQAFAELTPVLGSLDWTVACRRLGEILERRNWRGPLPLRGLYVVESPDELGPGYAAAWVIGASDQRWPRPMEPSPLLPRWFIEQHGLSGNAATRAQGARDLTRLRACAGTAVLSWPALEGDVPCGPSPALAALEPLLHAPSGGAGGRRARPVAATETLEDRAPPLAGAELAGGSRTLALQARCPLRAFCEQRLGARALASVARGLSPRQRGIALHLAAQELMRQRSSATELEAEPAAVRRQIERSAEIALRRVFGRARRVLATLFSLELEQLGELLHALLELDSRRAPFETVALEAERRLEIAGKILTLRLDRIDRLADGRLAVIDYKTGSAPRTAEWLAEPPLEPQLPLYAIALEEPVAAVATALLAPDRPCYRGFWPRGAFPSPSATLPEGRPWERQLVRWREAIESLVEAYAAGDVRVYTDARGEAGGPLAPLTRVLELAVPLELGRE